MGERDRSHKAFDSRGRRERAASDCLGCDVRDVPKAALAVVAFYLALGYDESVGFDAARQRIVKEWDTLHANGILETPVPARLRGAADKGKD